MSNGLCCESDSFVENTQVGPFLVLKKLGTNRRQRVYHARQTEQNRDVALKFISIPPDVEWTTALEKIELEVKELQKLKHPNLVKVYGAGVHEDQIFFATELVEGENLAAILSRRGKITPDLVVEYGRQLAEVLLYLHERELVHSKLMPEKILITPDHQVKVADLRLNRSKRRRWDSGRHRELDIAAYMAPEQFTEGATNKSDFYSLGVIVYEMLAGRLPYEPDTMGRMTNMKMNAPVPSVAAHVMDCPFWMDKIVTQMLQPNPRQRPHSARAIVLAFEEIRKLATNRKAAVDQMTGGFNALNAGADKTEARRLLGKKNRKNVPESSIFQSVPFMIVSLFAIVAVLAFMLWPPSTKQRMAQIRNLLESPNTKDWSEARVLLKPIVDGQGTYASEAEALYFLARRKSLVQRAERGVSNRLQSESEQIFGQAVTFQKEGRDPEAIELFQQLVNTVSSTDDERHIYVESLERLEVLKNKTVVATDLELLHQQIETTQSAETVAELNAAKDLLGKVILKFAGETGYGEVVERANRSLEAVKRRLAAIAE